MKGAGAAVTADEGDGDPTNGGSGENPEENPEEQHRTEEEAALQTGLRGKTSPLAPSSDIAGIARQE